MRSRTVLVAALALAGTAGAEIDPMAVRDRVAENLDKIISYEAVGTVYKKTG